MIPNHTNSAILVLGDSMLDVYVNGRVDRISPEAPVPVLLRHKETAVAGGAANVAANAVRLGAKAHLVSVTGEDADGDRLAELVVASGAVFHRIAHAGRKTTSKMRVLGDGHQLIRIDQEDLAEIAPESQSAALEFVARLLPKVSVLVISDYAKGMLTDRVITGAIALARQLSVPVLVDPKRREFSIYRDATLIKPNRAELARASGQSCQTLAEIEAASQKVIAETGAALLVTLSENGMAYYAAGAEPIHMPTQSKMVFDVSGAGDTTIATVACCVANQLPIEQTMRLANLAAGIVVSKVGTATVSLDELRSAANEHEMPPAFAKGAVSPLAEAVTMREHWRREGLVVGFTNGCFDLLHPGHVAILRSAAKACDRLIVGLNSDESVKRLKGPNRPVQTETARSTVIGAIHCVDLVSVFDEDTPQLIIEALRPDVLIKGADYEESQIVGAEFVKAHGGRVVRVPLVEGQSTTRLIQRSAKT